MTKNPSLAALNIVASSDTTFEFEYRDANGVGTGIFLKVLGAQAATVTAEVNRLVNDRRKRDAQAAAGRNKREFVPVEDDIEFANRLTAVRLVGWRGIEEAWSPENALTLVSTNSLVAEQVGAASTDLTNFTTAKSPA